MGKNIKSYATTQVHFPQEKGGKPYGKRSKSLVYNMVRLNRTYYSLLKLQAKFSITSKIFKIVSPSQNSSDLRKFCAIRPHSPRILQNSHILLTYSALCFRHLPQQRMLRNSSELRKFRAVRPHSPRIRRNLHHLLTLHLTFQMPDQWQRTP